MVTYAGNDRDRVDLALPHPLGSRVRLPRATPVVRAGRRLRPPASRVSLVSERVIDHGTIENGTRWTLTAGGSDDRYGSMLHIEDDHGVIDGGGMGGPKLWGNARLNVYTGGNPRKGPRGVVVRCHPSVERILLVWEDGTSTDITACNGDTVDGLRFGVELVPRDARLREVVGVANGEVVERFDLRHHDTSWHEDRD